jgi:hypothetical protein
LWEVQVENDAVVNGQAQDSAKQIELIDVLGAVIEEIELVA